MNHSNYKNYKKQNIKIKLEKLPIEKIIEHTKDDVLGFPVEIQREFVWRRPQVQSLLESILLGDFIGNLLSWRSKNFTISIENIKGDEIDTNKVKEIILDGKQRVTSLYRIMTDGFLEERKKTFYFFINFRALKENNSSLDRIDNISDIVKISTFEHPKEEYKDYLFPFNMMRNEQFIKNWINNIKKYCRKEKIKYDPNLLSFVHKKIDEFLKYKIPIITITKEASTSSMVRTFEAINTKGIKLNNFDFVVAKLSNYGIYLHDRFEKIKKIREINAGYDIFGNDLKLSIIQGMYLYKYGSSPNRTNLLKMCDKYGGHINDFEKDWKESIESAQEAIKNIIQRYGAFKRELLPSTSVLPVLIALDRKIKEKYKSTNSKFQEKIDTWYWSAVFANVYKKSTTTQMVEDFNTVWEWLEDEKKDSPKTIKDAIDNWKNKDVKFLLNLNSTQAEYKGVMCLMASNDPKDPLTDEHFSERKSDDTHIDHIFPKKLFEGKSDKREKRIPEELKKYKESVLNKSLISEKTNELKGYKLPSEYIELLISEKQKSKKISNEEAKEEVKEAFKTHFINDEAYEAMEIDDFKKFLEARGKAILEAIKERITPPQNLTQPRNTTQHDNTQPNKHNTSQHDQKYQTRLPKPDKT